MLHFMKISSYCRFFLQLIVIYIFSLQKVLVQRDKRKHCEMNNCHFNWLKSEKLLIIMFLWVVNPRKHNVSTLSFSPDFFGFCFVMLFVIIYYISTIFNYVRNFIMLFKIFTVNDIILWRLQDSKPRCKYLLLWQSTML